MAENQLPEDQTDEKTLFIFGRDVSKIPCYRNSLLCGIGSGIGFGLMRFMFTSQVLKSVNFSVYSFSFITLAYWIQCRYRFTKNKFEMMRMQELLRTGALLEGTEAGEEASKLLLKDVSS